MLAFIELFKTLGLLDLAAWQHVRIDERAIARVLPVFDLKFADCTTTSADTSCGGEAIGAL